MSLSSETMGERRVMKSGEGQSHAPEPENLQCPRCESTNTKFCYYNNYNLSQPRYFCKGCRRYWTRGGSLRNIPVGGGSRKNSKRSRISLSSELNVTQIKTENTNPNPNPTPNPAPVSAISMNLNEAIPGTFSSLLGSQQAGGFLGLGGYSLGLGPSPGFDMLGFGFGTANGEGSGVSSSGCNTWQIDGDGGDCFGWPDLAISTPGTAGLE